MRGKMNKLRFDWSCLIKYTSLNALRIRWKKKITPERNVSNRRYGPGATGRESLGEYQVRKFTSCWTCTGAIIIVNLFALRGSGDYKLNRRTFQSVRDKGSRDIFCFF